ncbi:hypothetical protein HNQ34_001997 [Anoxybacillus tepidamans]|uniref:Uncharacterized protein n=1 Tax=Anoxybacteroides tepidamans TaxID=265948 RepID=A0A7W8MV44_9BACL|nr:hypothetical protein [Anoxybacillus tepidamans]
MQIGYFNGAMYVKPNDDAFVMYIFLYYLSS